MQILFFFFFLIVKLTYFLLIAKKVADFIENSEWASKKDDVQELVSCIINAVKVNLSICRSLADLVQIFSSKKGPLSDLAPFLINYLLNNFI